VVTPASVESRPVASATSPPSPIVVQATRLSKTYGHGKQAVAALRGIDFELRGGECLGLLGANGSGKSTTLKLVLGTLRPTAGDVVVFAGPAGRRAARARSGYVPEEARRFGALSGLETIDLFARLQGVSGRTNRRQRVGEALDLVGLSPAQGKQRVSTYSRGMARRLAVATAWVHQPDLLVLDEPTSGLDPLGVEGLLHLLDRHRRRGGATLLSTHDRVTAQWACDRALVLAAGRVQEEGAMAELLAGDDSPSLISLMRKSRHG